jgi:hypothetical protein
MSDELTELQKRQILLEAKTSRFLLRERLSKVKRPYLVDAIVNKLERTEGLEMPSHLYMQRTKAGKP